MQSYEKLGVFYLGRYHDLGARKTLPDLLLYNSNDLLTHALCVGMTGSGKTGLCFDIIEEAAIDGIPAILIDPKGDLANLLLTFPDLRPADFEPWVNADEARKKGISPAEFAAQHYLHARQQCRGSCFHPQFLRRAAAGDPRRQRTDA
jgi:DNA helicase HerA-like ATPase